MGCDVPVIISNVFSKAVENTDTFVYVEAGRNMSENQLVICERNSVLVILGTEAMKYDIRICGLVTLNGKNGNFEMLLVSRKTKKRDYSGPSSPLSGGIMS